MPGPPEGFLEQVIRLNVMRLGTMAVAAIMDILLCSRPAWVAEVVHLPGVGSQPPTLKVIGPLLTGDERKFVQFALSVDHAVVTFNSEGGSGHVGLEIGKAIRLKQFFTLVTKGTYCASACALAWLGGTKRFMEPGSRIGFHAAYIDAQGQKRETGVGNALIGAYLNQLGLSTSAIAYISTAPPDSMQWLTASDANQYGIEVTLLEQEPVTRNRTTTKEQDSTPTNDGDQWSLRKGIDLFGFDLQRMPITTTDARECERQCKDTVQCAAFTFNTTSSACFLKSAAATAFRNSRAISGYKPALEGRLVQSPLEIHEATDYEGSDFQRLDTVSFAGCVTACEKQERCRAFSYVVRHKQCWLKSSAFVTRAKYGITSGMKTP